MIFSSPLDRTIGLIVLSLAAGAVGAAAVLFFISPTNVVEPAAFNRPPVAATRHTPSDSPRTPTIAIALVPRKALKVASVGGSSVADADIAAVATVVTSDGWLVTDGRVFDTISEPLALLPGGRALPATSIIRDSASGLLFFRVEAKDLDVVAFGSGATPAAGSILYRTAPGRALAPVGLLTAHGRRRREAKDVARSSVGSVERLQLSDAAPANAAGAGLLTADGVLAGIIVAADKVGEPTREAVPIEVVARALRDIVRSGAIHWPSIGLTAIDLSELSERDPALRDAFGAQVVAVLPDGPAADAGVKVGDRITALGRDALDGSRLLPDLLAAYSIGEKVAVTVARGEEVKTFVVTVSDAALVKKAPVR